MAVAGRLLYRRRGFIGVVAFLAVLALGRPTPRSCLVGLPAIVLGAALRFWAMGYIGERAWTRDIEVRAVVRRGPYRYFAHPLYAGNFLLVLGTLVALRPGLFASLAVLAGFVLEYWLIGRAEKNAVAGAAPDAESGFRFERALLDSKTWLLSGTAWLLALAKALRGQG